MYDIIGDIHGHADKLETLLEKLGYKKVDGVYCHPTRKAFFLGDFIDRGPKIKETLEIAKSMVESGSAKAIMGNHEFNLICFMTKRDNGEHIRVNSVKNTKQIKETLEQLSETEVSTYIDWFLTLPLWFEDENFRAVHACWDQPMIDLLEEDLKNALISIKQIKEDFVEGTSFHKAIETVLKGPEARLQNDKTFKDKDGNTRRDVRVAWWDKDQLIAGGDEIRSQVDPSDINYPFYPKSEKLVFFGHYWIPFKDGPFITAPNAQSLDFSVANGGLLVAYRLQGEKCVMKENFKFC
jgi:cell fate (sporulation/competence/biofilm development) regulator YlbF (YheA/YmcA/DUF963 family)